VRERRERGKWMVVRDAKMSGREKNSSSGLKVPRQCPLVLPVKPFTGIIEV
jgi:hypothetical protein